MKRMVQSSVSDLEAQTRDLEHQIHKLERRGFHMTPMEQEQASRLKKLRLANKDRLASLRPE
ncbi:YdcH family protein [Pendulispora albinea]|uniref:YdcH family protein n=1 Tax=Pendulispora albinea TaxID=2741071 RepID=A0ABZ2M0S7_9BACT